MLLCEESETSLNSQVMCFTKFTSTHYKYMFILYQETWRVRSFISFCNTQLLRLSVFFSVLLFTFRIHIKRNWCVCACICARARVDHYKCKVGTGLLYYRPCHANLDYNRRGKWTKFPRCRAMALERGSMFGGRNGINKYENVRFRRFSMR